MGIDSRTHAAKVRDHAGAVEVGVAPTRSVSTSATKWRTEARALNRVRPGVGRSRRRRPRWRCIWLAGGAADDARAPDSSAAVVAHVVLVDGHPRIDERMAALIPQRGGWRPTGVAHHDPPLVALEIAACSATSSGGSEKASDVVQERGDPMA